MAVSTLIGMMACVVPKAAAAAVHDSTAFGIEFIARRRFVSVEVDYLQSNMSHGIAVYRLPPKTRSRAGFV